MTRKFIVTAPPPTPNGDLHVGHLSGPFLASDVFRRYQTLRGNETIFSSFSDDNQSYVITSAEEQGVAPKTLCALSTEKIKTTLRMADIILDAYVPTTDEHNTFVQTFFRDLFNDGVIVLKEKEFFFCPETNTYLFESFVKGYCPECLAASKGGICETCGHPNNFTEILEPRATLAPEAPVTRRRATVAVLELERFRPAIETFYFDKWSRWRPHLLRLTDECLAKPLPDFPISYVHDWGVPAPFPKCDGQVINAWPELLTGLMVSTAAAARARGWQVGTDELWRADQGYEVVQFFGYDNSFFYAFVHFALLTAYGERYVRPSVFLTNEFYEFDSFKFSTSLGHLMWARELLSEFSADEVRFYLALSNPQLQRANFTLGEMTKLLEARLLRPWERLTESLNRLRERSVSIARRGSVSARGRRQAETLLRRLALCYEAETMDLRGAAEQVSQAIEWLDRQLQHVGTSRRKARAAAISDAYFLLGALGAVVEPLMPSFGLRLQNELFGEPLGSWDRCLQGDGPEPVRLSVGFAGFRRSHSPSQPATAAQ